eukprot:TRINITY_DN1470_c0_g1_i2.p1 TRINITY_DN1470_c0_g1~~TRINITY_DN1470_c0_g1_i2.p1  ORF type:complete len:858 (-),score=148.72 TRINITY_DN1470_c0_g1_i2:44-2617(-)
MLTTPSGITLLLVIKERGFVGVFGSGAIYRVEEVLILTVGVSRGFDSDSEDDTVDYTVVGEKGKEEIELVQSLLQSRDFYFSYTLDLTNSLQRKFSPSYVRSVPLVNRADDRFFWNKHILAPFIDVELHKWTLPLIRGHVQMGVFVENEFPMDLILISRLNKYRSGPRHSTAGADRHGCTANFVETEQILFCNSNWHSFVQVRGSVPVSWTQQLSKKGSPIKIDDDDVGSTVALTRHLNELRNIYKTVYCLNLLEDSGEEKKLTDIFTAKAKALRWDAIRLASFDVNAETRTNFSHCTRCIEELKDILDSCGYFQLVDNDLRAVDIQQGVIRSHSLDCLDRTTLIQSLIAREMLNRQLYATACISTLPQHEEFLKSNTHLDQFFRDAWAETGDFCSKHYVGTQARASDWLRTGKRDTVAGLFKDVGRHTNSGKDDKRQLSLEIFQTTQPDLVSSRKERKEPPALRYLREVEDEKTCKLHHYSTFRMLSKDDMTGRVKDLVLTDKKFTIVECAFLRVRRAISYPIQKISMVLKGPLVNQIPEIPEAFGVQVVWSSYGVYFTLAGMNWTKGGAEEIFNAIVSTHKSLFPNDVLLLKEGPVNPLVLPSPSSTAHVKASVPLLNPSPGILLTQSRRKSKLEAPTKSPPPPPSRTLELSKRQVSRPLLPIPSPRSPPPTPSSSEAPSSLPDTLPLFSEGPTQSEDFVTPPASPREETVSDDTTEEEEEEVPVERSASVPITKPLKSLLSNSDKGYSRGAGEPESPSEEGRHSPSSISRPAVPERTMHSAGSLGSLPKFTPPTRRVAPPPRPSANIPPGLSLSASSPPPRPTSVRPGCIISPQASPLSSPISSPRLKEGDGQK